MKRAVLLAACALSLMGGAGFAAPADQPGHQSPAPGTSNETLSAVKDTTYGLVGQVSAEMTTTTRGFINMAAVSDLYEVTAGKIALERSSSPQVKAFAQKMIDAHTRTTSKLRSIIAAQDIAVTPPEHVDGLHQGLLDSLRGAKTEDFDHRYISQQIAAHKAADLLFEGYAKDGDLGALRKFAAATDPDIKMHLDMAQKIDPGVKSASN